MPLVHLAQTGNASGFLAAADGELERHIQSSSEVGLPETSHDDWSQTANQLAPMPLSPGLVPVIHEITPHPL